MPQHILPTHQPPRHRNPPRRVLLHEQHRSPRRVAAPVVAQLVDFDPRGACGPVEGRAGPVAGGQVGHYGAWVGDGPGVPDEAPRRGCGFRRMGGKGNGEERGDGGMDVHDVAWLHGDAGDVRSIVTGGAGAAVWTHVGVVVTSFCVNFLCT